MFSSLFRRAEASVDNAIGDFLNRVLIAIPLLVALGFAAASLSSVVNRAYGPEIGNLIVAAAFAVLGGLIAIVVKVRRSPTPLQIDQAAEPDEADVSMGSLFDNEHVMALVSTAAPILLPALLRTATKNWPLILAVAAGLYVFSFSEDTSVKTPAPPMPQTPQA